MTFRKEVLTRLIIKIEMATIDLSVAVALFSATVRAVQTLLSIVRLGVCLPYCVNKVR